MAARKAGSPTSNAEKQQSKRSHASIRERSQKFSTELQWNTRREIHHTAIIEPGLVVVLSQISFEQDGREAYGAWSGTVTRADSGAVLMHASDDSYEVARAAILEYVQALASVSVERDTPQR